MSGCAGSNEDALHIQDIHGLALDPNDSTRLYVATHHGLFVAEDDTEWSAVTQEPFDMMGFSMSSHDGNVMYASGHPNRVGQGWAVGVVRSTDGGRTWTTLALQNQVDFHAMAMEPGATLANDTIYGFHGGKLHVSRDGGLTWTTRTLAFAISALTVDPKTGDLFAATPMGIQRSDRFAEGLWQQANATAVVALAVAESGSVYAYLDGVGLAESRNRGATWSSVNWTVPAGDYPWGIAPGPAGSGVLYVGTAKGTIHKTADSGTSWTTIR